MEQAERESREKNEQIYQIINHKQVCASQASHQLIYCKYVDKWK